ncbi:hypothetical protein [Mangrovibacter plantisponsor]|uniref:Uncharacterized protein n=1 Tax=Mangrovibacter plantisponsor TaxID=451513 RepID=A0A317Q9M1_9ENTR|nr:hypothetical protein [Mangrovibacter plantisponsor]PWW12636.1 hypothetical protein DES37_101204 [Mangrovibacter plantisponsor]
MSRSWLLLLRRLLSGVTKPFRLAEHDDADPVIYCAVANGVIHPRKPGNKHHAGQHKDTRPLSDNPDKASP